jgi:hypothetical protein
MHRSRFTALQGLPVWKSGMEAMHDLAGERHLAESGKRFSRTQCQDDNKDGSLRCAKSEARWRNSEGIADVCDRTAGGLM